MSKLKDMINRVSNPVDYSKPNIIANRINNRFEVVVTASEVIKAIDEKINPRVDEEEIERLEKRYKGYYGEYYF